jgi:hypothetical protein
MTLANDGGAANVLRGKQLGKSSFLRGVGKQGEEHAIHAESR